METVSNNTNTEVMNHDGNIPTENTEMRQRRTNQLEERRKKSRDYMRLKRLRQTEIEKEEERKKNREAMRLKRQQMRETMNTFTEERNEDEETNNEEHIAHDESADDSNDEEVSFIETFTTESVLQCIKEFQEKMLQTLLQAGEEGYIEGEEVHQACVCVVCDRFIIGIDKINWITTEELRFHRDILSSNYHYKEGLNPILKGQYTLNDERLCELLLSPRARHNLSTDSYMSCSQCRAVLCPATRKQITIPPKFAISNGFAIGSLPMEISQGITPVVNNLVAPIRAFNYFLTFNGGREQKITGNFTFFAQNISENVGALTYTADVNNASCVYVMLQGPFTKVQLNLIRKQGIYNVDTFRSVYKFLHTNNPHYIDLPAIEAIPIPIVQEITDDNCGEHELLDNAENKEDIITWKYWFPNVDEPTPISGTHDSQSAFAEAILTGETPTLIYHPSQVLFNATLSQLCPTAFPFGTGDVNVTRKPRVSELDCLKHYLQLSLPHFSEGQTVLLIHHIYQRKISFLTGITKCNKSTNGVSMATQVSDITTDDIDEIITQMKNQHCSAQYSTEYHSSNKVKTLLQNIRTCCIPIGYTNEAASEARSNMFAMWTSFGPPSLLFTISPCDECSFNMQLFATAEKVNLPGLHNWQEIMSSNLSLRKKLRVQYPGAAAREFDNLFQIVLHHILGWGRQHNIGIFGKLKSFSAGIEEQGRTSLHAHIILWLYKFQNLQTDLFSENEATRNEAKSKLKDYMNSILSTSFNISEIHFQQGMMHKVNDKGQNQCDGNMEGVSHQTLRNMRHRQHLKDEKGVILRCDKCSVSCNTFEMVTKVIQHLIPTAKNECPEYPIELLKIPLTTEQMDFIALRFRFDMIKLPHSAVALRKVLQLIMLLYFNTHDWKHRKSCFKKGVECRFHLPQLSCEETTICYNTENIDEVISGVQSYASSKWYYVDGSHQNVCSYEIIPKRFSSDVFVNSHNPVLANILGYNNNVCMGSINTLYYCTLYSSKSNQEEETYPYKKALEAVSKRIKSCQQNGNEVNLSSNQVGLRRLLSGINAHISSCVVSATMAWYLVVHGSRFQYSHEFKPLLLTQLEAWYHSEQITQRIRYKRKRSDHNSDHENVHLDESSNEVWFDSEINNYLFRPKHEDFNNLSVWEFHCKYDMQVTKPDKFMEPREQHDTSKQHWRFEPEHPGFLYCCLVKRKMRNCIPKIYYRTKFPDVASLEMDISGTIEINTHTQDQRELYALKALLLFLPFRDRSDLTSDASNLWTSFTEHRSKLQLHPCSKPHLYYKTEIILQNIQNLYNVKKVPSSQDKLLACTNVTDEDSPSAAETNQFSALDEEDYEQSGREEDVNAYIESIMKDINDRFQSDSAFNNHMSLRLLAKLYQLRPYLIPVVPTNTTTFNFRQQSFENTSDHPIHQVNGRNNLTARSLITVVTTSLDVDNINASLQLSTPHSANDFDFDLTSIETFATQNNLDVKQRVAFRAICASFILSYLHESDQTVTQEHRQNLEHQLYKKGASSQLLMCVTGPGGSGKSHVIKCCRMYCKTFCSAISKHFDFSVFPITATSNSAASLLKGKTIHSAALLNNKRVSREYSTSVDWTATKILIIDEISMAGIDLFRKLDKNLRILTGKKSQLYGGLHIVSMGDFMQLSPVGCPPLYRSDDDLHWHGSLNAAVFLDQANHRFSKDPVWGEILLRIQKGEPTTEDLQMINERLIKECTIPSDIDCTKTRMVYGCFSNKRRNEITNACFLDFVLKNNPEFYSNIQPPTTTLLIKGCISKENNDFGMEFHKLIWNMCGDNDLDSDGKKVDPCLRLIQGCALMSNSNTEKDKHFAKGAVGNFIGVKWKTGCSPHIEDFHGYKVFAASINDIEYLMIAREGDKDIIQLKPESVQVKITFDNFGKKVMFDKCNICQFPVNLSLATTGHKLQGMTKDILILAEISTRTPNWLYVVLSRVTTLKGLYLMEPLTKDMFKPIPKDLQRELLFLEKLQAKLIQQCE